MPAKSKAQARFMGAVASGSLKKPGLSKEQAKEYIRGQKVSKLPEKVKKHKDSNPHALHDLPETMEKGSEQMAIIPKKGEPFHHLPKELKQRASDYKEKGLLQPEWLSHPQIKSK
jgi:hypothetical protein